jgi:uncharacterized membrane protein
MMWLLVIVILVWVYYSTNKNNTLFSSEKRKDAEEILQERFVKGEIDELRYLEMKETLRK